LAVSSDDEKVILDSLIQIREQVMTGEDFGTLAKMVSDDQSSKDQNGDLGWLNIEDFQIPVFKSTVDTLQVGEVSWPFRTQFGYHLVKLEGKQEARKYSLDDDYDEIKMAALNFKQRIVFQDWIEELKEDVYIVIREEMIR
jgi:peptidyl-prolyl cis-trans isomerase SurA